MRIGRLAPCYRWIEYCAFGRALERRRFAFLPAIAAARRVLILGEGDGRFLARLLTSAPQAHFDVVETSAEMIALARRRVGAAAPVAFHHRDARDMAFPLNHYDLIVTNFFWIASPKTRRAESSAVLRRIPDARRSLAVKRIRDS